MALRTSRPRSLLQDENAISSAKSTINERKGLQQQPSVERKKLSNITNQVFSQQKLVGKGSTDLQSAKKLARPPLANISNGSSKPLHESNLKTPTLSKQKMEGKPKVLQQSAPSLRFPPSSKLNLTEEMKKKAALWAEEGIETVSFTGEDAEKLREKLRNEEIAKRVAMTHNFRSELPIPRFSVPHPFSLEPLDILEPDLLKDLEEDLGPDTRDYKTNVGLDEDFLGFADSFSISSPPRITEGWPRIYDEF